MGYVSTGGTFMMSKNYIVRENVKTRSSAPTVISKLKEILNLIGVFSAAVVSGGLFWAYLGQNEKACDEIDDQNDVENLTKFSVQSKLRNEDIVTSFNKLDEENQLSHVHISNCERDEPDGESDEDEDTLYKNSRTLGTCSTSDYLVDADMIDIWRAAKEARAMIRKLSVRVSSNCEEEVNFDLGVND